jgi:hypothetical protein
MLSYRGSARPVNLALRHYFPSFRQLRRLTLSSTRTSSLPQQVQLFSAFQETLLEIHLQGYIVTAGTFIALINYFPNLSCMDLRSLGYRKEDTVRARPLRPRQLPGVMTSAGRSRDDR